jgi:hypothetical protein
VTILTPLAPLREVGGLGLPTIPIIITGVPVFSYLCATGPSLFEHEYEYHFIEYEYEGSQKVVGKPKVGGEGMY